MCEANLFPMSRPVPRRRRSTLLIGSLMVAVCAVRVGAAPPTAADRELLASADLGLGTPAAFRSELTVTPLAGGDATRLEIWRDGANALMRFLDPKNKAKAILRLPDGAWLLARGARPVKLGNAGAVALGMNLQDLLGVSYSRDFELEDVTRSKTGTTEIVTFALRASAPGSPFPRVRYVVQADTRRPLRVESCLASGRLARMVEIAAWRPGPRLVPAETVAKDLVGGRPPMRIKLLAVEERKPPAHLFELTPDGDAARAALGTPGG